MKISINADICKDINYALCACMDRIVQSVNISCCNSKQVILKISAEPGFIYEYVKELTPSSDDFTVSDIELQLNESFFLNEMSEERDANLNLVLMDSEEPDKVLALQQERVHIASYLHWDCHRPESVVCFMQPNSPLLIPIIKRAAELANEEGGSLTAYYSMQNSNPEKIAGWIYEALKEQTLHYNVHAAGFENVGQKLRIPDMVLNEDCRQGNCLDLSILFASCLMAAGLHPVVFRTEGHAFSGVWTDESAAFSTPKCSDLDEVRKNLSVNGGSLIPVECTLFTDGSYSTFSYAVESATKTIDEPGFKECLDINQLCRNGYKSVFKSIAIPGGGDNSGESAGDSSGGIPLSTGDSVFSDGDDPFMTPANTTLTKLEKLIMQAMDLSLGNPLLSKKADSLDFTVSAKSFFEGGYAGDALYKALRNYAGANGISEDSVDKKLYGLFKTNNQAKRANGNSVIYLAVNYVSWLPADHEEAVKAPVYLCPVEIFRNTRGETVFTADCSESFINPVFKEKLRGDYSTDISSLLDFPEGNYEAQLKRLERIIENKSGWQVCPDEASLCAFQMPNEAIYCGLKSESLTQHDIVSGILSGRMTWNNEIVSDGECTAKAVYAFPADESQRRIIESVDKKRAQVVFGPAGCGKSQTIANVISEKMADGKSVLFVTEKATAQEVVFDKLKEIGLDRFCLMLPDGKHTMSEISKYVENAMHGIISCKSASVDSSSVDAYAESVKELSDYCDYLKLPGECGKSLLLLIDELAGYEEVPSVLSAAEVGDEINCSDAESVVFSLESLLKDYMPEFSVKADYLYKLDSEPEERDRIAGLITAFTGSDEACSVALSELEKQFGAAFTGEDRQQKIQTAAKLGQLIKACPFISKTLALPESESTSALLQLARIMAASDPRSIRYAEASRKFHALVAKIERQAASGEIDSGFDIDYIYRIHPIRPSAGGFTAEEMALLRNGKEYKRLLNELSVMAADISYNEYRCGMLALAKAARGEADALIAAFSKLDEALAAISRSRAAAAAAAWDKVDSVDDAEKYLLQWRSAYAEGDNAVNYVRICKWANSLGIGSIVSTLTDGVRKEKASSDELVSAFRKCRCEYNIAKMLGSIPRTDAATEYDYSIGLQLLRSKGIQAREDYRKTLLNSTASHMPDLVNGVQDDEEMGALQRLIRRGSSNSVRDLFVNCSSAMMRLFPCMIMGPGCVAEYFPDEMSPFDLVIIDEGSQLPSYKALIPLSKASGCIVVGDEKQLSPTSFFAKSITDESGSTAKMEAIMEDAIIAGMPQMMLEYHYRSKYEGLVAFSNSRYYGGRIISFPNPNREYTGVSCIYVEDGIYDRGDTRTNVREAERVIELIDEIYGDLPEDTDRTVGIITFNIEQKKLIDELIRMAIKDGNAHRTQMAELVDVVNLEACQGKEWDITIISPAYGYDTEGKFSNNLGPMSRDEGRNRLNVLTTRARMQMYIVTSMKPDMFDPDASSSMGDIRDFIAYAAGELSLDTRNAAQSDNAGYGMQNSIAEKLSEAGYTVDTNIGCSGCKVDVGVVDESGKNYRLGILLDDFTGRFNPVDKEILIPSMLERNGWNIYRLHAVNWYRNPDRELQQIKNLLK